MSDETEILPPLPEPFFDTAWRGYNRQQVDEYLTRIRQHIQAMEQWFDQAMNDASPEIRQRAADAEGKVR